MEKQQHKRKRISTLSIDEKIVSKLKQIHHISTKEAWSIHKENRLFKDRIVN